MPNQEENYKTEYRNIIYWRLMIYLKSPFRQSSIQREVKLRDFVLNLHELQKHHHELTINPRKSKFTSCQNRRIDLVLVLHN